MGPRDRSDEFGRDMLDHVPDIVPGFIDLLAESVEEVIIRISGGFRVSIHPM